MLSLGPINRGWGLILCERGCQERAFINSVKRVVIDLLPTNFRLFMHLALNYECLQDKEFAFLIVYFQCQVQGLVLNRCSIILNA